MKTLLIFVSIITLISGTPTPIVLWHGMGDTCCISFSLGGFKVFLEEQIPGVYVTSLRIGNSTVEDFENGYFMKPDLQVQYACKVLSEDPQLKDGFNAIGFSQGSQFLRAVVQRCGGFLKIKNLITLGGQHQGVYGLPHCGALKSKSCDYVRKLLNFAAYNTWVQNNLVQATYWHDPLAEKTYQLKSAFLSDLNNELNINETYVENLYKLEHFVLVKFNQDSIVQPRETEWFGFYVPGQSKELYTLQESRLYLEDRLGLQKMEKDGKLVFLATDGDHLHFSNEWMIKNIIPYLLN
ncbi:palmitoyl-protein thioesterase 1 [Anticarsia gemmatalis]|uniref:palmitoyl-protein thioesterase 1 n=1 Tax=Anticarsia gemmatalis TaxID=129554 RepID=UPI003F757E6A